MVTTLNSVGYSPSYSWVTFRQIVWLIATGLSLTASNKTSLNRSEGPQLV